jgi:DNA-directed RNA polymerase specialized sigma24 family protein
VTSRRFDTDAVLKKILEHDQEGFNSFYERYRGRVFRFIVRQYGTGEYGKAAYYSAWRHLVVSGLADKTPKALKLSFYQYLGSSVSSVLPSQRVQGQTSYLPKDIEQDGNWSLTLIEHFKHLTEDKKRFFLFKHEIGISEAAIARTLGVKKKVVENSIEEAENELRVAMTESGCPSHLTLEALYRGSRVVKPPVSWDKEIIESFTMWIKQTDHQPLGHQSASEPDEPVGLSSKWNQIRNRVKSTLSNMKSTSTQRRGKRRNIPSTNR